VSIFNFVFNPEWVEFLAAYDATKFNPLAIPLITEEALIVHS
jgi:hypothetical protein